MEGQNKIKGKYQINYTKIPRDEVKATVLHCIKWPGSYWGRSLSLLGIEPAQCQTVIRCQTWYQQGHKVPNPLGKLIGVIKFLKEQLKIFNVTGKVFLFIYLFGVLRRFQHFTGHIMKGSWKGRGNQYIQFVRVLYCKLPTNGKQLPAFPLEAVLRTEPQPQR